MIYIILQLYIKSCFMQNYILYEIYDCALQYVQFFANSHNYQTNNIYRLSIFKYNTLYNYLFTKLQHLVILHIYSHVLFIFSFLRRFFWHFIFF